MNFLIDECLHPSLVRVAGERGHDASHVVWLGLSGAADWDLIPRIKAGDYTFVTNNAQDFRKLYAKEPLHAGLVVLVPQVTPERQRILFDAFLTSLAVGEQLVNEAVELEYAGGEEAILRRYGLPRTASD